MKTTDAVYSCGKCGICIQTCPAYKVSLTEPATPRGKVQIIRGLCESSLDSTPMLKDMVSECLMCGACTKFCPSGIDHESLYIDMRRGLSADHGEDWKKRIFFHLLSHENKLKTSAMIASYGQNKVFEKIYSDVKVGNIKLSAMPKLNRKAFRDSAEEINEPADGKVCGEVAYFTGCSTNYAYESVGKAVIKVLTAMGYRVRVMKDTVCCGLPMYLKGAVDQAGANIKKNIETLSADSIDMVITDCATCTSALTGGYSKVLKIMGTSPEKADELAAKTVNINTFINQNFEKLEKALANTKTKTKITYHAPCHERNHGGSENSLSLLAKLPGTELHLTDDFGDCCGGGGTFFMDFPKESAVMVGRKVHSAEKTGAQFWVTGCPGCRINLAGNSTEKTPELIHPAELIARLLEEADA